VKYFHPGVIAARWARNHPAITKVALGAIAKPCIALHLKRPHIFDDLSGEIGYLVPVKTKLGNGMQITVPWNDVAGNEIYNKGWYEEPTVEVFRTILKTGTTFIDVGANVGQYTLLAAGALGGEDPRIHSFEPAPTIFPYLADNVAANDLKQVRINQCALGDSDTPLTLYLAQPHNLGATSLRQQYCYSGQSFQVPCTTLDAYVAKNRIAQVDAMKIDVEGAEMSVLRGADLLLSGSHRPVIVIEYEETAQKRFGSSCAEMTAFLSAHGYGLERITDHGVVPYSPKEPEDYTFNVIARPVA